jgi:hypothetical protein
MNVQQAATELFDELSQRPWLTSVGVGELDGQEAIYVYVKSPRQKDIAALRGGYKGFPVIVEKTGTIRPARSESACVRD